MKDICGIYRITNLINNKCYIGSSIYIHKRYKDHIRHSKAKRHANTHSHTMIIAINGLPNSGKDTIGKMIQSRLNTEMDFSNIEEFYKTKRWKIKKFASYPNYMYNQVKRIDFLSLPREEKELERVQFISFCEGMKSIFGKKVWSNLLLRDYILKDNWIITDLRFSEELDMIEEVGGFVYTIHITSP